MLSKEKIEKFEALIGYQYKNKELLSLALTHSSYSNEKNRSKLSNNERLEFLGDAVLELASSEFIYNTYPDMLEGKMTKLRASVVCEPTLAMCAREIRLGDYLMVGKGEECTGGRDRDSILSDAMEAVIGSLYLDGGFTNAKEFVCRFILSDIENKKLFYDSKTILQELVQGVSKGTLSYGLLREEGPDHDKKFTAEVLLDDKQLAIGCGRTKKAAEQAAAYKAILLLNEKNKKKE